MSNDLAAAFKPMLAKDANLEKIKFPLAVQPKLDGIRASVVNGKLVSRTLKPIPNEEIRAFLEGKPELEGLDGELIVADPTADDAYRKTVKFVMSKSKTGQPWCFHVFDYWDSDLPFVDRHQFLREDFAVYLQSSKFSDEVLTERNLRFSVVQYDLVRNAAELEGAEIDYIGAGYEGVIARVPDSLYKFGRSGKTGPLLKIKRFIDFEARIVGVEQEMHNANEKVTNALGRSERSSHKANKVGKGTLGALVAVAINGPHEGEEFKIGTGFTRDQRADLWTDWHAPGGDLKEGTLVVVKSFPIGTKDKPRHPVMKGFRSESDLPNPETEGES